MAHLTSCGAHLLLAESAFAIRLGGSGADLGRYLRDVKSLLRTYYASTAGSDLVRDLVITVAPGSRIKAWLAARPDALPAPESESVLALVAQASPPQCTYRPILFAFTYTVGDRPFTASLNDFCLPAQMRALFQNRDHPDDTEELMDRIWATTSSGESRNP